jgi:thioredoxin 1
MNNRTRKVLIVAVLIAAIAIVIVAKNSAYLADSRTQDAAIGPKGNSGLPMLLDLGSNHCVPCKMMKPILQELTTEYASTLRVEFIDVLKDRAAMGQYGVSIIPTQIFYDASGEELFRHEGFYSKEDILAKWKELGVELSAAE